MADDKRLLKSYVWHDDQCFFVSTIERDSSAMHAPGRYAETLAWEYDWESRERGEQIAGTGSRAAFPQHMDICRQLFINGEVSDE